MAGQWTPLYSFVTGAIRRKDLGYLILSDDEASALKQPHAVIRQWTPTGWGNGGIVQWRAAGAAITHHPAEQLIVVGEFGIALLVGGGDRHEEQVSSPDSNPSDRGPLRGVRRIGDNVYVVGMDRQVYRREGLNSWSSYEKGIPRDTESSDADSPEVYGFEAVDGFSEADMFAVGWEGEIWNCRKGVWRRETSPVNVVLVDVCCGGDGYVYACGRNGVLIRGKRGKWNVVELGDFSESLWSVAWYAGHLYAASMENVFVLGDDGLAPVYMGEDFAESCYDLVVGAGVLWSIGAKDVMSFDGQEWTRID